MSSLFTYDNFVHALAGSVILDNYDIKASGTAMSVFYPLDTVRSRLQLEEKRKAKSTLATMRDLIEEEGVGSLYRGLEPVLYSLFTSGFVYFYSFHGLRRIAGEKTALKDLAIGAVAGAINVLTTTPLWVVNTRIKMQGARKVLAKQQNDDDGLDPLVSEDQVIKYKTLTQGLIQIMKEEGPKALWSGTIPSLVLVTNPAVQFMIFEMLKRNLKQMLERKELSPFHVFALGAISKSVSTVLSYPLQVVQSKKRYGSPEVKNKSMTEILADLLRERNLFKGLEAKLLQTVMTTALMYVFYERIYEMIKSTSRAGRA